MSFKQYLDKNQVLNESKFFDAEFLTKGDLSYIGSLIEKITKTKHKTESKIITLQTKEIIFELQINDIEKANTLAVKICKDLNDEITSAGAGVGYAYIFTYGFVHVKGMGDHIKVTFRPMVINETRLGDAIESQISSYVKHAKLNDKIKMLKHLVDYIQKS